MYQEHFGLKQEPFSIAPDPRFLYLSDAHNEALAHLLYGFSHGGFVLISGEVGTGKTTLLRNLLDRTPPEVDVAFILNPRLTVRELLETLCEELGVHHTRNAESVKHYIDSLNRHLLQTHQAGRSTVVVIDEAQNLSPAVLEQIRLLTNLETNEKKLLRIILLGQPELTDMLARTELRQLSQRITARYHLKPLGREETAQYVTHRLARAGGHPGIFSKRAIRSLYRLSGGTPRLINVIADRAMLGAYVRGEHAVSAKLVRQAAREVFGGPRRLPPAYAYAGSVALALAILGATLWLWRNWEPAANVEPTARAVEPVGSEPGEIARDTARPAIATTSQDPPALPAAPPATQADPAQVATTGSTVAESDATDPAQSAPVIVTRPQSSPFMLQRDAFQQVFERWGATYPAESELIPCDFAPTAGLQCLRRSGGWSELMSLNTPVVLELWDDQASPYYGALLDQQGAAYRLYLGDAVLAVVPGDLRDAWFGTYVLLWQPPPGYQGSVRQGDEHATVAWLREQLAGVTGALPIERSPDYFDSRLREAVLEFQRESGLLADGVVGPLTWIHLNRRLGVPAPQLHS